MKQVILGNDMGYLIPKKVVEDKLREEFKELKDKDIKLEHFGSFTTWSITCLPKPKLEKKGDYAIEHSQKSDTTETIIFKKELLNKLFGIKGNITRIGLEFIKDKLLYRWIHDLEYDEYLFNNNDVYYFFEINNYETKNVCEMS